MGRLQELGLAAALGQAHEGKKVLQDVLSHGPAEDLSAHRSHGPQATSSKHQQL